MQCSVLGHWRINEPSLYFSLYLLVSRYASQKLSEIRCKEAVENRNLFIDLYALDGRKYFAPGDEFKGHFRLLRETRFQSINFNSLWFITVYMIKPDR